jgi:hypothetical protein
MSIIVRKIDDVWQEWHGDATIQQMVSTYNAVYDDGRTVETPCDPYPVNRNLNGDRVRELYDAGIWSLGEVIALGAKVAVPFVVPAGKQTVGAPSYVEADGVVQQNYDVEDIPPPPDPLTPEQKIEAMLGSYDLSVSELKRVLGLGI